MFSCNSESSSCFFKCAVHSCSFTSPCPGRVFVLKQSCCVRHCPCCSLLMLLTVTSTVASPTCLETFPASSCRIIKQYWPLAMFLSYSSSSSCFLKSLHQLPRSNTTIWSFKDKDRSQDLTTSADYSVILEWGRAAPRNCQREEREPTQLMYSVIGHN